MIQSNMRQVEIPHDYFYKMSKKDYSKFETALIREFFQNSYDAGAKQFVVDYNTNDTTLTIFDDGCGMDYDTIINKLLVMGMSHKTTEDAVGAFGHAKILLYFSWNKWEIRTRNYLVTGSSHYYTIEETDDYINGTISTIHTSGNIPQIQYYVKEFFQYCQTNCAAYFCQDGTMELVPQTYKTTDQIYTDGNYDIFKSNKTGWYIYIRQNGVFMFKEWINSNSETTQAIVEVKKRPEAIFLQNRDYFNSSVKDHFNMVKQEFAVDSVATFALNHSSETKYNSYTCEKVKNTNGHLSDSRSVDILTFDMDDNQAEKELTKKRTFRLVSIAYAFMDMMVNENNFRIGEYKIGITKSNSCHGRFRVVDNVSEIYFNLNSITEYSPNYRKMAVILLNILKHELAHAYTKYHNNDASHNENFVRCHDSIHDTFWDIVPFINKFKEIWKDCGK